MIVIKLLNTVQKLETNGGSPCHVSIDSAYGFLHVANYGILHGGSFCTFQLHEVSGQLSSEVFQRQTYKAQGTKWNIFRYLKIRRRTVSPTGAFQLR